MSFIKKPGPPQGSGPREVWLRNLLAWVSQFECTSVVGMLKKDNPSGGYSLVPKPVAIGAAAPATSQYRGQWSASPPAPYMEFDIVLIATGTAAGTYISTINNNAHAPDTGIGWVQIAPGDAFGRWS